MAVTLNANALTTVADARAVLGLTPSDDDIVMRLVNSASQLFESRCGRKFLLAALAEDVNGYGSDKINVSRAPIQSVSSIEYQGAELDLTDMVIHSEAGLIQLPGGFVWTAHTVGNISRSALPGTERPLYTVNYEGGWITPQHDGDSAAPFDGDSRDLPYDIEEAVLSLIRARYAARRTVRDPTLKSQKLRTWGETYDNTAGGVAGGLPADTLEVIERYRVHI